MVQNTLAVETRNRKAEVMLQAIIDAIRNRKVLTFTYNGIARVVEPHAVGVSRTGNDALRCYQIQGGHITPGHEWDFCDLSQISAMRETGDVFAGARPGYRPGDKHMTRIYAEL